MTRARIHALRPGVWPASPHEVVIGEAEIGQIAAAYDRAVYSAPVVLGHPEDHDPAWGEVLGAEADEQGLWLEAEIVPELTELVREGRYRAVSVSLWPPDAAGNPRPGGWYLRHLGLLGAAAPAVKGLAPLALGEPGAALVITTEMTGMDGSDTAAAVALAEREGRLAERERNLADAERRLAERERELARAAWGQEIDALIGAARVLPTDKPGLVALMESLSEARPVTLSEGERPALDELRAFLGRLPPRVELRELAAGRVEPDRPGRDPILERATRWMEQERAAGRSPSAAEAVRRQLEGFQ